MKKEMFTMNNTSINHFEELTNEETLHVNGGDGGDLLAVWVVVATISTIISIGDQLKSAYNGVMDGYYAH
jgi:hypothetical protein